MAKEVSAGGQFPRLLVVRRERHVLTVWTLASLATRR
jgi:hypothetical protein